MNPSRLLFIVLLSCLAGCATGYTAVDPGVHSVSDLDVNAGSGWNRVPGRQLPWARRGVQAWTQNGMTLDRLVLIPQVEDGESIYLQRRDTDYPSFRADMDAVELSDLVGTTIELAQGANQTEVVADNTRAHRFGDFAGIIFDLDAVVHDGPAYKGIAGAFVAEDRLYVVYFLGAVPHYYDQLAASALTTIESAGL